MSDKFISLCLNTLSKNILNLFLIQIPPLCFYWLLHCWGIHTGRNTNNKPDFSTARTKTAYMIWLKQKVLKTQKLWLNFWNTLMGHINSRMVIITVIWVTLDGNLARLNAPISLNSPHNLTSSHRLTCYACSFSVHFSSSLLTRCLSSAPDNFWTQFLVSSCS